jgi:hypothetical protein
MNTKAMTEQLRQETRREWRALGFFYDYQDAARCWIIRGSRNGLRYFADILREYAREPAHAGLAQHEHYGPYSYLKLVTWSSPRIVEDGLYGQLTDFQRLSEVVEAKVLESLPGASFRLEDGYGDANEAALVVEVASDDFDPAEADVALR